MEGTEVSLEMEEGVGCWPDLTSGTSGRNDGCSMGRRRGDMVNMVAGEEEAANSFHVCGQQVRAWL